MSSSGKSHPLFYISEEARLIIWRVIYWLAFVLTWAILPILQSFVESGYHDPIAKLLDSLRRNAKYQAIVLGSGLIGLVYVILTSGLSLTSIKALVIALSYLYALVMAIWLMGHGMVNVPRELWVSADVRDRLNMDYKHASKLCDTFADAQSTYLDVAAEIVAIARFKDGSRHLEWIDELLEDVESGTGSAMSGVGGVPRGTPTVTVDRSMINDQYLSNLSARFYRAKARMIRHRSSWQKLLKDCSIAQDIVDASNPDGVPSSGLVFRYGRTILSPRLAKFYFVYVNKYVVRAFAVLLAGISIIIVWSELAHGTVASLVNLIVSVTYGIGQQAVSSIFLGYMCIAAFASLTRIRIFNVYGLVHKGSDLSSMLFFATYACRLTVPLSYNYLILIGSRESVFEEFLGKSINLTPLGKFVSDWLPRLILVPILFTAFHFYDKVRDYLSFELGFDDDDEEGVIGGGGRYSGSSVIEGKELVSRALSDPRFRFAIDGASPDTLSASRGGSLRPSFDNRQQPNNLHPASNISGYRSPPQSDSPGSRILGGVSSPRSRTWLPADNDNDDQLSSRFSESLDNVKSFFGSLGQKVQEGISSIRANDGDGNNVGSGLPRWARLNTGSQQQHEEETESLVL